ncbi:MAG: winged helix-turn-helix domain-containing protein [Pseudomonadota bacterium]|nr:winged helix-turn-helix domain-containing protein [Pseudomonadota bacterium]
MSPGSFRFDRFGLDPRDRQLWLDGAPVELNARYLDALTLLVSEQGALVSKERFLGEVWRGVPVTDEALTQCIRTLRRRLGDDAARPRFIETVPKHGYRFIAAVERVEAEPRAVVAGSPAGGPRSGAWPRNLALGGAGMAGGGVAGVLGGLFYGFVGASQDGMGGVSIILVLVCLTVAVGLIGGAGVGLGIAAGGLAPGRPALGDIVGGALGGLIVGGVVRLIGLDAFNLLFGQSPGDITGAPEGTLLGAAVGLGAWLGSRAPGRVSLRRGMAAAALAGGVVGAVIPLTGGRLMAGSLAEVAGRFPDSRLRLDQIGALFGEAGFGPVSQIVTSGLEGALFSACVVGAMILARRAQAAWGQSVGGR